MAQAAPQFNKRSLIPLIGLAVIILLMVFGSTIASVYVDWLWFSESMRASQVFAVRFNTRLLLFLLGLVVFTVFAIVNVTIALRSATVVRPAQSGPMQEFASRVLQFGRRGAIRLVWIAAPVVGVIYGLGLMSSWETVLVHQNAVPFGVRDPIFGLDAGFYVFHLPFWHVVTSAAMMMMLIPAIAVVIIYLAGQGIAGAGRLHLSVPSAIPHLNILFGLLMGVIGFSVWLGRYDAVYAPGHLFSGPSYLQAHVHIPMLTVLAYGCWALGAAGVVLCAKLRGFKIHLGGIAVLLLAYLFGFVVYGGIVQKTVVEPNEPEKEGPYISHAIRFTRRAYMLDKIVERQYPARPEPTAQDVEAGRSTLNNMRLWDYRVLDQTYDALQTIKQYYTFRAVDVDRYDINGHQTMVNLGVRELHTDGLDEAAKRWQNLKFQYTHGYGVVMNPVNQAIEEGKPRFIVGGLPPVSQVPDIKIDESRIYFGEGDGAPVFVKSKVGEFDLPEDYRDDDGGDPIQRFYRGNEGIGVGSFGRRLLLGMVFGDIKIMTTDAFRSETKMLMRRNILDRASAILPFLAFDPDPYPVVADGRVYWMLDGYTFTNAYPYSEHTAPHASAANYIRNSVKVTIDAATGELKAYNFDPDDPILKVYMKIYPRIAKPLGAMPKSLLEHIRYPEQLFMRQCEQLVLYHITDPRVWYQKEDRWSLPMEAGEEGQDRRMEAYYVQMRIPDEPNDSFILMMPFTPYQRPNLAAWLAAGCDPGRYGQLTLYRFPKDRNLFGPRQAGNQFYQNEEIAQWTTLMDQKGSEIIRGNLLVVPLGQSLIYVEPFYLRSTGTKPIPELKKVALGTQTRVVLGNTYQQALDKLFGEAGAPQPTETSRPGPSVQRETLDEVLAGLRAAREEARAALARGDWAAYGEAQKRLDDQISALERLIRARSGNESAPAEGS